MNGLKAVPKDTFLDGDDEDQSEPTETILTTLLGAPVSMDWRQSGAVTSVKNQGSCGSCYSFAATAALEGAFKVKTGTLVDLSTQQLLDCTSGYGNMGCSGGLMSNCFNYLKSYKMQTLSSYPYIGYKSTCKYNSANGKFNVLSYVNILKGDVAAHMNALVNGPVAVAMAASSSVVSQYRSGIISSTACGTGLNHGVTMVGYGTENGTNYWIVKNSWGSNWGESGYFRILKSSTNGVGICGILSLSSQAKI